MDTPPTSASPGFLTENLQILSSATAPMRVEMLFRVWSTASRETDPAPGENAQTLHQGLLAFLEDVVASKQGVLLAARNQIYVSVLKQPTDALVVARRVQLGLQGFRGKQGGAPVAVSIAIDSSNQSSAAPHAEPVSEAAIDADPASLSAKTEAVPEPSHDLLTLLKISKPAQVLVTHDLCQRSAAIKGLPLKSFPARFGVFEYLWTSQERLDQLQSEPQLTLAAVAPAHPAASEKKPAAEQAATSAAVKAPEPPLAKSDATEMVRDWRSALRSPRFAVFAGLALVIVGIGSFVAIRMARESSVQPSKVVVTDPNTKINQPSGGSTPQANPGSTPQPNPGSAAQNPTQIRDKNPSTPPTAGKQTNSQAQHKTATEKHPSQPPATPSAPCTLQGDPSRYINFAEQARGRGDYANAIRRFREILACDPSSNAAREGLNRAIQGQEQTRH
jgi:hypothetical protein